MENINLIRKIAWSYHKTTGIEFDELFAEASLAYAESLQTWQENKGTKVKWACIHIHTALRYYLTKYAKKPKCLGKLPVISYMPEDNFADVLLEMPEDCRKIAEEVLRNPEMYVQLPPKMARGKLHEELRKKGWPHRTIWETFKQLSFLLA